MTSPKGGLEERRIGKRNRRQSSDGKVAELHRRARVDSELKPSHPQLAFQRQKGAFYRKNALRLCQALERHQEHATCE